MSHYLSMNGDQVEQLISRRNVLKQFQDGGEIATEIGADGVYLRFDCACLDALPFCQAQCCALRGTLVFEEEIKNNPELKNFVVADQEFTAYLMARDSDGFCTCLDRSTRKCSIYEQRPDVCRQFHCTLGPHSRGWKLANKVHRQSND